MMGVKKRRAHFLKKAEDVAREEERARHEIFVEKMADVGLQVSDGGTLFLKTVGYDKYCIELKIETPLVVCGEREPNFYAAVGYLQALLHEAVQARSGITYRVEKKKKRIE